MLTLPAQTETLPPESEKLLPAVYTHNRLGEWLLFGQIISSTFLQKIAVPFGSTQLYFGFLVSMALCAIGFFSGRLELNRTRFPLYLFLMGGMALTQVFGTYPPSMASFIFLLMVHIPYVLGLKDGMSRPGIELEFFQKIAMIMSVLGIFQYFIQYIIGDYAFFMESVLPKAMIMQGFNGMNPTGNGDLYKSTAFFMLEPSVFSQLLAVALVIEIVYFKRLKVLALFLAALGLTFSGTGLIILFLLVPFYLVQKRRYDVLCVMLVALLTAPFWAPAVGLGGTVERVAEFNNVHTSGYARFLSMFPFIDTYIIPHGDTLLLGRGAGSIPMSDDTMLRADYETFNPTWAKLFFEYGMIGTFSYFVLMAFVFIRPPRSAYLKWALFIQFLILGEFLFPPTVHSFIVALLIWPSMNAMQEFHEKLKANKTAIKKDIPDAVQPA